MASLVSPRNTTSRQFKATPLYQENDWRVNIDIPCCLIMNLVKVVENCTTVLGCQSCNEEDDLLCYLVITLFDFALHHLKNLGFYSFIASVIARLELVDTDMVGSEGQRLANTGMRGRLILNNL